MVMSESMAGRASKGLPAEKELGDQGINASQLVLSRDDFDRGAKNEKKREDVHSTSSRPPPRGFIQVRPRNRHLVLLTVK